MRSVVVTVGEELLSGQTVDTNAAWIGRELAVLGIPVTARFTVGDRDEAIAGTVLRALDLAPLVVVTGGLGPTEDDRTRPAVAAALGVGLDEDPLLVAALEERFRGLGQAVLPPLNRRQALVPRGGAAIHNPAGTAPGLWFPVPPDRAVVLVPGPPRELRAVWPGVTERIRDRFGASLRPVHARVLHTTGIPESVLAPQVEEALGTERDGLDVAFLPDLGGVDVRLTVADRSAAEAAHLLAAAEARLAGVLAPWRFEAPGTGDLVEAVAAALRARGWTLATAESCTGGGVAGRLTGLPGSSAWFLGGVVAYANELKERLLGVAATTLARHGAVSEEVAGEMARGVLAATGADCAVAITGIAGPGGGTEAKPVGTVCWAAAWPDGKGDTLVETRRRVLPGDREAVRVRAGQAALALLLRRMDGSEAL